MELEKIKKKREELMTNYNSLVDKRIELEKQLELTNTDILTMRGAILLSIEFIDDRCIESCSHQINIPLQINRFGY